MLRSLYRLIRFILLRAPSFLIRKELANLKRHITDKIRVVLPKRKEKEHDDDPSS